MGVLPEAERNVQALSRRLFFLKSMPEQTARRVEQRFRWAVKNKNPDEKVV